MNVVFTPPARLELIDAVAFYELQHPGLGARFKQEVRAAIRGHPCYCPPASAAGLLG